MVGLAGRLAGSVLRVRVWSLVFGGAKDRSEGVEASSSLGGK